MKKALFLFISLTVYSTIYSQNYFSTTPNSINSNLDLSHLGTFTLGSSFESINDPWRAGEGRVLEMYKSSGNISMRVGNNFGKFSFAIAGLDGAFFPTAKRGDVVVRSHTAKKVYFSLNNSSNDGTSAFVFGDNINHKTLSILNNGKVGIGTINPDATLTVKGNIHAEEILVNLSVPPDFVFQKYYTGRSELKDEYILPSLEDVESFIKKEHHLPKVPSAKKILKEGLQIKQMTSLLLQKIEELTLYTIEQEKRIKVLEAKLIEK